MAKEKKEALKVYESETREWPHFRGSIKSLETLAKHRGSQSWITKSGSIHAYPSNSTMKATFRCDSSTLIGSGHVIRCRTLARQLRKEGVESYFVCRNHIGNFNRFINGELTVYELKASYKGMPKIMTNVEI